MHEQDTNMKIHDSHLVIMAKKTFMKCAGNTLKKMWFVNNATVFPDDPKWV